MEKGFFLERMIESTLSLQRGFILKQVKRKHSKALLHSQFVARPGVKSKLCTCAVSWWKSLFVDCAPFYDQLCPHTVQRGPPRNVMKCLLPTWSNDAVLKANTHLGLVKNIGSTNAEQAVLAFWSFFCKWPFSRTAHQKRVKWEDWTSVKTDAQNRKNSHEPFSLIPFLKNCGQENY